MRFPRATASRDVSGTPVAVGADEERVRIPGDPRRAETHLEWLPSTVHRLTLSRHVDVWFEMPLFLRLRTPVDYHGPLSSLRG